MLKIEINLMVVCPCIVSFVWTEWGNLQVVAPQNKDSIQVQSFGVTSQEKLEKLNTEIQNGKLDENRNCPTHALINCGKGGWGEDNTLPDIPTQY